MMKIFPIILCGGSGTRLWPVSRKAVPKPFLPLVSDETLFEQAVRRVAGDDRFAPPMVVAGADHADLIMAQLGDLTGARLVIEPVARNTAPAIALAAALLPEDAVMLVCPSDHHIADNAAFRAAALAAAALAREDYLVSFGIAADRPETGYGYLQRWNLWPEDSRSGALSKSPIGPARRNIWRAEITAGTAGSSPFVPDTCLPNLQLTGPIWPGWSPKRLRGGWTKARGSIRRPSPLPP